MRDSVLTIVLTIGGKKFIAARAVLISLEGTWDIGWAIVVGCLGEDGGGAINIRDSMI